MTAESISVPESLIDAIYDMHSQFKGIGKTSNPRTVKTLITELTANDNLLSTKIEEKIILEAFFKQLDQID